MPDALSTLLGLAAQGGGGADVVQLAGLRQKRRGELIPRAEAGDPLSINRLSTLDQDIAEDPFSGEEAQAGQDAIEQQLSQAAMFNRPEIRDVRNEQESNALRRLVLPIRERANLEAQQRETMFAQQLLRDKLNADYIAGRQTATGERTDARAAAGREAQAGRQDTANAFRRSQELRKEAGKVNPIMNFFTGRREKLTKEADALAGQHPDASQAVALLMQQFPGQSLESLIAAGEVSYDTPEELAALQAAFAAAGQ